MLYLSGIQQECHLIITGPYLRHCRRHVALIMDYFVVIQVLFCQANALLQDKSGKHQYIQLF